VFREAVEITTLPNGLRVVSEYVPSARTIAAGVYVGVGGRFERASEAGLTHFIEHMVFKGTPRRTARDIAVEIESRGGMLNAYTEKEYTAYYARALAEDAPLVLDVISDMLTNPLLSCDEVEREKNVVMEEIRRTNDCPEDAVHDLLDRTVWPGHPLGRPILGTRRTVAAFTSERIRGFMRDHYEPGRTVVAAAGKITHRSLVKLAGRHLGTMTPQRLAPGGPPPVSRATHVLRRKRAEQVQFCVGMPAFSHSDERKYTLTVLDMVLGGSMGSRLFQEIREKRGLAYDIGSHVSGFRDAGLFTISGGTSLETFDTVLRLIREELKNVAQDGLTEEEIAQAKRRLRGLLVLGLESTTSRMMGIGRSLLLLDRVVPLDEVLAKVDAITHEDIIRVAQEVFPEEHAVLAAIGPFGRNGRRA
jgi:predicted Zn-dependent peptidase